MVTMGNLTLVKSSDGQKTPLSAAWGDFDPYCRELEQAVNQVRQWITEGFPAGQSLLLSGEPGTGKSKMTVIISKVIWSQGKRVNIISEPDLFSQIRETYGQKEDSDNQFFRKLLSCDLLIIDDLGTGHVKADSLTWAQDIYWRLFDKCEHKIKYTIANEEIITPPKPIIVTTNLGKDALRVRLGDRAYSRLLGALGKKENLINLFDVPDYRLRWLK
jgi:hypothetical protein